MKGLHKKFNRFFYDKHDGPAKSAMEIHLKAQGHTVTVPVEDYGADVHSEFMGVRMYHEVEVSRAWQKGEHPFPTGSIPERKIRLVNMHKNEPLFFWMLRLDLFRALCFSSIHLVDEHLVEVPNSEIAEGEYFYRIPKHLGKEFDLLLC